MATEEIDPRFAELDAWDDERILMALLDGQAAAVAAVAPATSAIAEAVEAAAGRLSGGDGRLIYVGAGTSGRIGVQDGAELAPTFNWPRDRLAFLLAGGEGALVRAIEDAEDSEREAERQVAELGVGPPDVVVAVAASGTTPFTVAALRGAAEKRAVTIGLANNPDTPLLSVCDHPILIETGPEVVAGSTRLAAGTAQKAALNLFSTLLMIRLGRVYRGMMVQLQASNAKLRRRSARIVARAAEVDEETAVAALGRADGDVKLACLVACGVEPAIARRLLSEAGGHLREAVRTLRDSGGEGQQRG